MEKHRGKILANAIEERGIFKATIAKKLGISRATMYNMLERDDVPLEMFIKIGKILQYDFSKHIPEIHGEHSAQMVQEPRVAYGKEPEDIQKELNMYKHKYLELLEENRRLMRQLVKMK